MGSAIASIISDVHLSSGEVILVVCPPHLVKKWAREMKSVSPGAFIKQLNRHEDIKAFMDAPVRIGQTKIGVIKRDMTKLGAGWEPAAIWQTKPFVMWRKGAMIPDGYTAKDRVKKVKEPFCPHCGKKVMRKEGDELVPVSKSWLESGKRTCSYCHQPLWQEVRNKTSTPPLGQTISKNPRYRIDSYLKQQYPDRIGLLIWDEVHEAANSDTGNGEAFGRMAGVARKVLALTGTPFNGRSSSMFNLEYHLNERIRKRYPWGGSKRLSRKEPGASYFQYQLGGDYGSKRGEAEATWVEDMGVLESIEDVTADYDPGTGTYTSTSTYQRPYKEAPGVSALLVAEILDHAVFFSLTDLGKALPDYEEIAYPVDMDDFGDDDPIDVEKLIAVVEAFLHGDDDEDELGSDAGLSGTYNSTMSRLKDYLIERRFEGDANTFRGAYLQWAMGWVNTPHIAYPIIHNRRHPVTKRKVPSIVKTIQAFDASVIYPKERHLINLVREELANDRPCVIYIRQTNKRDIQPRLAALLEENVPEAQTYILRQKISAEKREKVIQGEIDKGVNVIICNPELVKTGLDLIYFPTLIFYEIVFNLSTMMQAAARSFRLNQTHKLCKTYYMYYEGTMEGTAVALMSRKQRAAKMLTGDTGLTGLDALTEDEGSFEEALLEIVGADNMRLDANAFKDQGGSNGDDNYWTTAPIVDEEDTQEYTVEEPDPEEEKPSVPVMSKESQQQRQDVLESMSQCLAEYRQGRTVTSHISRLESKLTNDILNGVMNNDDVYTLVGMNDPLFFQHENHQTKMVRHVASWLRKNRYNPPDWFDRDREAYLDAAQKIVIAAMKAFIGKYEIGDEKVVNGYNAEVVSTSNYGEEVTQLRLF